MKTKAFSYKFNPKKVAEAKKLGLDLPDLFRSALDEAIHQKECPVCGAELKAKAKPKRAG